MELFVVSLSIEDAKSACENYIQHYKRIIKEERIKIIGELLAPRPNIFFGLIKQKPICADVKSAIRYMKKNKNSYYLFSIWENCKRTQQSMRDAETISMLLRVINSGILNKPILLDKDTAFLVSYIRGKSCHSQQH